MDQGFSILMLCFAAALLAYAALMAVTKDYRILPYRSRVSVKPKDPKRYMVQMAKTVTLVSVSIAAGALVALWSLPVGAVVMLAGVIAAIWIGTKLITKVQS